MAAPFWLAIASLFCHASGQPGSTARQEKRPAGSRPVKLELIWGPSCVVAMDRPGRRADRMLVETRADVQAVTRAASGLTGTRFNPQALAERARDLGADELIVSARTPEGFLWWDDPSTPLNATRATPLKRDVLRDLADACQNLNLKLGLVIHLDDLNDLDSDPFDADVIAEPIERLLRLVPASSLRFAGDGGLDADAMRSEWLLERIRTGRAIQVNGRLGRGAERKPLSPDFLDRDDGVPEPPPSWQGRALPWECRMGFPLEGGAAYWDGPRSLRSSRALVEALVLTVSRGGSFVLSVGLDPTGAIPDSIDARLREVTDWLKRHQTAVVGVAPFEPEDGEPNPAGPQVARADRPERRDLFLTQRPRPTFVEWPVAADEVALVRLGPEGRPLVVEPLPDALPPRCRVMLPTTPSDPLIEVLEIHLKPEKTQASDFNEPM